MQSFLTSVQLWTYTLVILCLSPLSAYLGSSSGWRPGVASFAILAIPTCSAALLGSRGVALIIAGLSSLACLAESHFVDSSGFAGPWFLFPLFATTTLFMLSITIVTVANALRRQLARMEAKAINLERELHRNRRAMETPGDDCEQAASGLQETPDDQTTAPDEDPVNHAMMLLAIQDVTRRVSIELELETLIPTIISSAKDTLHCEKCEIYFWNSQEKTLKSALPIRPRDRGMYVPSPTRGLSGWVIENRHILTRRAVDQDYDRHHLLDEDPQMPDAIAPLAVGSELLGLLVLNDVDTLPTSFSRLLYILSNFYALGIKNAQMFENIQDMARKDGLTGLLNHAQFQQELQQLLDSALEHSSPLILVMADIDHFKKFNDSYGHQVGDHVLRQVAGAFQKLMPNYAPLARYGGEEFIFALPGEDLQAGLDLAETLRQTIEQLPLSCNEMRLKVTASFGVSQVCATACTPESLVRLADESLYQAKARGRNRVVCHPSARKGSDSVVVEHVS